MPHHYDWLDDRDLTDAEERRAAKIRARRRAEARPPFVLKTIIRKRGDQDPQTRQEDPSTGEDPKGAGDSAAARNSATKAEQYPVS